MSAETSLLNRLLRGDEHAFDELVDALGPAMLRVAKLYVGSEAVAEEVVQEAWIRVLRSLRSFEGRSSLRTWIFVILGNVARTRGEREGRSTPLSAFENYADEPSVDPERFFPASHPRWAGMWSTLVDSWETAPHEQLLASEARVRLKEAFLELPDRYAVVFMLRDVEGWPSEEVCAALGISPENQRVLLHRARSRLRARLEEYFERGPA